MGFRGLVLFPFCAAVGLACVCGWVGGSQQEPASVLAPCQVKERLFCERKTREKVGLTSYEDAIL